MLKTPAHYRKLREEKKAENLKQLISVVEEEIENFMIHNEPSMHRFTIPWTFFKPSARSKLKELAEEGKLEQFVGEHFEDVGWNPVVTDDALVMHYFGSRHDL